MENMKTWVESATFYNYGVLFVSGSAVNLVPVISRPVVKVIFS